MRTALKQQDRPRTAAYFTSAGNSELEPDDRQKQRSGSLDRQGSRRRKIGGRTALFSSGLQCRQRDVRCKGGHLVNGLARDAKSRAALATQEAPHAPQE